MRRRDLPKHVSVTKNGYRVQIRIHGTLHRQRFRHGTSLGTLTQWITRVRTRYAAGAAPGSFAADAARYLEAVKAMPTYAQREQHIQEWVAAFGETPRDEITAADIRAQLQRWRTEPRDVKQRTREGFPQRTKRITLSADSVNKRRSALMHLYTVLDGKAAPNPVKDTPKFSPPTPPPKAIPYGIIRALFHHMPASKSKARLQVIAYTGLPNALVKQIQLEDVDLDGRTVAVHGRRKGAGTAARIVPLTLDGVRAFKAMEREEAWGTFSNATLRVVFQRAQKAAGLAGDWTPYDLRHSFGTEVYRTSGDIRATQVLMGHSTPQLTHRYTMAAVDPRVLVALKRFGKRGH